MSEHSLNQRWHPSSESLADWIEGTARAVSAASVEQHVMTCEECRAATSARSRLTDALDLTRSWESIQDRIEPQRPTVVARGARRMGLSESDALATGSTQTFAAAWIGSLVAVTGLTVLAAMVAPVRALEAYLLIAPLVPMVGIVAAYGDGVDPTFELTLASPYSKLRLLLLRSAAVLVTCVPLTIGAGILLQPWWVAVAWLLPSLALVLLVLALSTWTDTPAAAAVGAGAWVGVTVLATVQGSVLTVLSPGALALCALGVAAGAGILTVRRDFLSTRRWS